MKTVFVVFLFILTFNSYSQNREHAFEVNKRLGRGINYGNMFEAPSETGWGNPWKPQYAKMIADLGFNHVRIPIRWEPADRSSANAPFTISATFLNRIKQVVDSALNNNLHAIINMHHHEALFANPEAQKERFLAQWRQISAFFKDYPDSLLFEILNEPNGNITPKTVGINIWLMPCCITNCPNQPGMLAHRFTPQISRVQTTDGTFLNKTQQPASFRGPTMHLMLQLPMEALKGGTYSWLKTTFS